MFEITGRKQLAEDIVELEVNAPKISRHAKAGQFVVLRVDDNGERIPLTLYDWDDGKGAISIVFLEVGVSTKKLGSLKEGEFIADLVGPLGKEFPIKKYGRVACVGGGVGVPAIHPIARALKQAGNEVTSIIGARHKELLILEDEMNKSSDGLLICTDDGSCGTRGFVTQELEKIMGELDLVVAVGPVPMMRAVAELTREKAPCIVSLNPIMVDGTGMCGACRVTVGGETKFACVDGPDFDAHKVDFETLSNRNKQYAGQEREHLKCWERDLGE